MAIRPMDKQIATLLQAEIVAEVDKIADKNGVSRSEVMRRAILEFIEKTKESDQLVQDKEEGEE